MVIRNARRQGTTLLKSKFKRKVEIKLSLRRLLKSKFNIRKVLHIALDGDREEWDV